MKKLLTFTLAVILVFSMSVTAFADLPLKPVEDPWNNPEYLINDGNIYYTCNEAGYVVMWETPACDLDGKYLLLNNNTTVLIDYQVRYMDEIPWGSAEIIVTDDEGSRTKFRGWILMTDLRFKDGTPGYELPVVVPEHPVIADPLPIPTEQPVETEVPATDAPQETSVPKQPNEAITVSGTYNDAIVYTSVAIAVGALALVVYMIIKHKALNKKGE